MSMTNEPKPPLQENPGEKKPEPAMNLEGQGPQANSETGIQEGPSPAATATTVGPQGTSATPPADQQEELIGSWLAAHLYKVDKPYQVLTLVLAFLLGAFAAAHSGIWMHLATGRLLAEGKHQFGVDPFSYTTEASAQNPATPWIDHSWLFSWISYVLYVDDGTLLVVIKALLGVALASLLFLLRPRDSERWATVLCVLLTMLALSPQLHLQPIVVSFLFLGVTLFLLHHGGVLAGPDDPVQPKLLWGLPILFALWVNLDSWFLLGPLTVFLCLAMAALEGVVLGRQPRASLGMLGGVLGVGLLACLLNPHHVQALLTLPSELGFVLVKAGIREPESFVSGGLALEEFQRLEPNFVQTLSPLSGVYLAQQALGLNVAGISFFVLLVVAGASFYLVATTGRNPGLNLARVGLAVFFAVLALLQARLVPFFAVVGGVVTILNWQEYLGWRGRLSSENAQEQVLWANLGRLSTGFLLFGLFFLAWPGWLNYTLGDFSSPRRVAFGLDPDPSLKSAAEHLGQLHKEGKLSRGLNLSPEIANYCAWYAPGTKYFFDYRYALFSPHLVPFNNARQTLSEDAVSAGQIKRMPSKWRDMFEKYGIDHVVGKGLENKPRGNTLIGRLALWSFWSDRELQPVYADGKTLVVAWKKKAGERIPGVRDEWHDQVFSKNAWALSSETQAKLLALEQDPGFWKLYLFGQMKAPLPVYQADLLLEYFEYLSRNQPWRYFHLAGRWIASPLAAAGLAAGPLGQDAFIHVPQLSDVQTILGKDIGPAEAPLLAIRSLRQGQALDPQNPRLYYLLKDAFQAELGQENHWVGSDIADNLRLSMRKIQYVGALRHYLLLNPQDHQVQWMLGDYFLNQNYFDLALEHMQLSVLHMEKIKSNETEFYREKAGREQLVLRIEHEVKQRLADFELRTSGLSDIEKVRVAVIFPYKFKDPDDNDRVDPRGMGLVQKARQILDNLMNTHQLALLSDAEKLVAASLTFELAKNTGALWELNKVLSISQQIAASNPLPELKFYLNAATGAYQEADEALEFIEKETAKTQAKFQEHVQQDARDKLISSALIFGMPDSSPPLPLLAYPSFYFWGSRASHILTSRARDGADKKLVRGLLALEMGDATKARGFFEESLRIAGSHAYFPDRKIAERFLQLLQQP